LTLGADTVRRQLGKPEKRGGSSAEIGALRRTIGCIVSSGRLKRLSSFMDIEGISGFSAIGDQNKGSVTAV